MNPHAEELRRSKRSIMRVNRQGGPDARRRSRKLLSCAPCRSRKVKCDRAKPCIQCIRSRTVEACDYNPGPPPPSAPSAGHQPSSPSPIPVLPRSTSPTSASTRGADGLRPARPRDCSTLPKNNSSLIGGHGSAAGASAFPSLLLLDTSQLGQRCPAELPAANPQQNSLFSFRGKQSRTRFFGRSHWASTLQMFPDFVNHTRDYMQMKDNPAASRFHEYLSVKRHERDRRRPVTTNDLQNSSGLEKARFVDLLPSFEVANHLINLYMSTYETTFRVVHEPSFLQDWASFWDSRLEDSRRSGSEDILLAKYLTMMACASCLANDTFILAAGSDQTALSQLSHKWLQAVVLWLDSIPEHALLDLHVMQVKCLLVTARQAIAWSGDLVGIMAGSLIREAVMMGLHRDPALFSNMSPYWAETRKRLWLTVVETELQLSLHLGIPLALSWEDFDCPLPINIEDEHFSPSSTSMPPERDISTLTKTTFQIVLAQSLRVRMEISKLINRARLRMDSNEIMSLSDSLMSSLNEAPAQLRDDSGTGDARNYAFQRSFYMFLIWRSMLALHRPVFLNLVDVGKEVYSVSRMHCVQASVALLAQLELVSQISADVTPRPVDMFLPHVLRLKGGLFQDDIFHAALTVCLELRLELKDNQPSLLTGRISNLVSQSALFHRKALFQSIENALEYFKNKVQWEARACKTFTTLCILHMNLESQFATRAAPVTNGGASSSRPALSIEEACPLASRRCLELLEGTRHNSHRNPIHDEDDDASLPNSGPDEVVPGSAPWNGDIMTDMSNKEMRDLALDDLDFDWTMPLEPLPFFPFENWPSMNPSL